MTFHGSEKASQQIINCSHLSDTPGRKPAKLEAREVGQAGKEAGREAGGAGGREGRKEAGEEQ